MPANKVPGTTVLTSYSSSSLLVPAAITRYLKWICGAILHILLFIIRQRLRGRSKQSLHGNRLQKFYCTRGYHYSKTSTYLKSAHISIYLKSKTTMTPVVLRVRLLFPTARGKIIFAILATVLLVDMRHCHKPLSSPGLVTLTHTRYLVQNNTSTRF